MTDLVLIMLLGLGGLIGLAIAVWMLPRITRDFGFMQRYNLLLAALMLLLAAMSGYGVVSGAGRAGYWSAAAFLFAGGCCLYTALRSKRDRDSRGDYASDPSRCGQCGYDLRGTVGAGCPECGWDIPGDLARIERRDWPMWWRGWRISYLEDWKKTLASTAVILLMFMGLLAWGVWQVSPPAVMIAGIMALHFAINLVRVGQYGVRRSPSPRAKSS